MLSTDLQKRFMQLNLNNIELEYSSIYLTNALFGVCQTWIAHGKKRKSTRNDKLSYENVGRCKLETKKRTPMVFFLFNSASRTRTYDIMINSHALLPTELWRII